MVFLRKRTQMLYNTLTVICCSRRSFYAFYFIGRSQILVFLQFVNGRLNASFFIQKYQLKHVCYIFEIPEEFGNYFSRCVTKRVKLKVSGDVWPYRVYKISFN